MGDNQKRYIICCKIGDLIPIRVDREIIGRAVYSPCLKSMKYVIDELYDVKLASISLLKIEAM